MVLSYLQLPDYILGCLVFAVAKVFERDVYDHVNEAYPIDSNLLFACQSGFDLTTVTVPFV